MRQNKLIKLAALATFAVAMTLNLSSNIAGELNINQAQANETGATTGSGTTAAKSFNSAFPLCDGVRICKGKSVAYMGTKYTCIPGNILPLCDDEKSTCQASSPCP